jgi:hypothetical protein
MLWTKEFWKGAGERAIKTFFQTFVAVAGTSAAVLQDVDWLFVLSGSALASLLSLATSIGNADFTAGTPTIDARGAQF